MRQQDLGVERSTGICKSFTQEQYVKTLNSIAEVYYCDVYDDMTEIYFSIKKEKIDSFYRLYHTPDKQMYDKINENKNLKIDSYTLGMLKNQTHIAADTLIGIFLDFVMDANHP